jgi:spermidine/putrescine transport system ATP-binding protein
MNPSRGVPDTRERPTAGDLKVERVRKSFGPQLVLDEVSFHVQGGEFVTLLGPSGCGKTTLLRIVAGLETADAGRVLLSGRDLCGLPANRRPVNTVFQSYALFPHLDVFENVAFGLRARRFAEAEIKRRVESALELVELAPLARRHTHQLSGGQRQRVALARAVVNEPEILLLDEPMSALDAKLRAEVQIELRRLQRRLGTTFILVTHDQNEAMTVSDRILVMRGGQVEQDGAPAQVYDRPATRFVAEFLGLANLLSGQRVNGHVQTAIGDFVPRILPDWERGTLAIRPERILLRAERPSSNALQGTVTEVIYRGNHQDLFVQPGGLRIRANPGDDIQVGQAVWLELPSESLEALVD